MFYDYGTVGWSDKHKCLCSVAPYKEAKLRGYWVARRIETDSADHQPVIGTLVLDTASTKAKLIEKL